ncbi:MAG: glutathione peroxidase [Pseudomonadales bacterium]
MKLFTAAMLVLYSSSVFADCPDILNYETRKLRSQETINFCEAFENKVVLMVNTASRCGYTPQFSELEALFTRYKDQGLAIVGFPSNDFRQEYSSEDKVADVCYVNYGVSFPMVATSPVRGNAANAMFQRLEAATGKAPGWNFNKYLVSSDGKKVVHFPASAKPLGAEIEAAIKELL